MTHDTVNVQADAATLPESVLVRLRELDDQRATIIAQAPLARIAEEAIATTGVGSHVATFPGTVVLYVHVQDQTVEKSIAPILRHLRRLGFKPGQIEQRPESAVFEVSCVRGAESILVYCHLVGASCRFVQVGTREVPVMELRCDGAQA